MTQYNFDRLADRRNVHAIKWCPKSWEERFGELPEDTIPMWIADLDFELAPPIADHLQMLLNTKTLGYIYCYDEFYDAVKWWNERKANVEIPKEAIILDNSVVASLHHVVQAYGSKDDCIIINTPVYNPFRVAATTNNIRVVENPLRMNKAQRYELDFELLEEQIRKEQPKLFIFCSPHNPSGRIWTKDEVTRIAELCEKYDVLLVVDEVHSDHLYSEGFYSALSLPALYKERVVVLNSANKGFNFAGLKTSYAIIVNENLRAQYQARMEANHAGNPTVFGVASVCAAYTDEGDEWLRQCYDYIVGNWRYAEAELQRMAPAVKISPLESSYLMWLDVTGLGMSGDVFADRLAKEAGVLFQAGSTFGQGGEPYVRVNLGTSRQNVEEALKRFEHWLNTKE